MPALWGLQLPGGEHAASEARIMQVAKGESRQRWESGEGLSFLDMMAVNGKSDE